MQMKGRKVTTTQLESLTGLREAVSLELLHSEMVEIVKFWRFPGLYCTSYYVVASGDTCSGIWMILEMSSDHIYALNPGINCQRLQGGQKVCIGGMATLELHLQLWDPGKCPITFLRQPYE
jgi:LysM domain